MLYIAFQADFGTKNEYNSISGEWSNGVVLDLYRSLGCSSSEEQSEIDGFCIRFCILQSVSVSDGKITVARITLNIITFDIHNLVRCNLLEKLNLYNWHTAKS